MKNSLIFSAVFFLSLSAKAEQFVSLTLCSDRLLAELARPEQIAAQSPYSKNPLMMLDKINTAPPILEAKLMALLPYLDKTFLINENFYPQLTNELRKLGAKIIAINDTPQTPDELFKLILQLGELTHNKTHAEALINKLKSQNSQLNLPLTNTLMLSDTGATESYYPQYSALLNLLGLTPLKMPITAQNFSLEKILLSEPNVLIEITDQKAYNEKSELLKHPLLQNAFKNKPLFRIPMKYTYCFDHGVWMGAELIYKQNL